MIVADTDVLIEFLENRSPAAEPIGLELERGQLRTTAITRFELFAGWGIGLYQCKAIEAAARW